MPSNAFECLQMPSNAAQTSRTPPNAYRRFAKRHVVTPANLHIRFGKTFTVRFIV